MLSEIYRQIARKHSLPAGGGMYFDVAGRNDHRRGQATLVNARQLMSMLLRSNSVQIPGLETRQTRRAVGALRPSRYKKLEFFAGEVAWFRPRVAVFANVETREVIKIYHCGFDQEHLRQEIEIRERLRRTGQFNVPAIIDFDLKSPRPWIVEQFVVGRVMRLHPERDQFAHLLLSQLLGTYEAYGMRTTSLDGQFSEIQSAELQLLAQSHPASAGFFRSLKKTIDADISLMASVCHNDLSLANIIINDDGGIEILDWEFSVAYGFVGVDIIWITALELTSDSFRIWLKPVLSALRHVSISGTVVDTLTAACVLLALRRRSDIFNILDFWQAAMQEISACSEPD